MTLHRIDTDTTTTVIADTQNDVWLVQQGVTLATSGSAIDATATANYRTFFIEGHVVADNGAGIALGVGSLNRIVVGSDGSISSSSSGINIYTPGEGDVDIRNSGDIFGLSEGIYAYMDTFKLTNDGTIGGFSSVVTRSNNNAIVNNGIINGGLMIDTQAGQTNTIVNTGTIIADLAIGSSTGNEAIANFGLMKGVVVLGFGGDTFSNSGQHDGGIDFGAGDDTFTLRDGGHEIGNILMGSGNDRIEILGGTMDGFAQGMSGSDIYIVRVRDADIVETGADSDLVVTDLDWRLGSNFENLILDGDADVAGRGNELANSLTGNSGDNRLMGYAGDDTIEGGDGADRLDGGAGVDTASYSDSEAGVTVNLAQGRGRGGDAEGDSFASIENAWGSFASDRLLGNAAANALYGDAGADRLDGRAGNDRLQGGDGSDAFVFAKGYGTDTIVDFAAEGAGADAIDLRRMSGIDSFKNLIKRLGGTHP